MTKKRPSIALQVWYASPRRKRIAKAALAKINAGWRSRPKCGAKSKSTGKPCEALALENGRCRSHGGLTPKGDQWHKPQLPSRPGKRSLEKLRRKEADLERRRQKRAARLAAMSPDERAKHEAWHKTHKPGEKAGRRRVRAQRETREWLCDLLDERSEVTAAGDVFA